MGIRTVRAGDEGQATLFIITGLAIALVALTMLFLRLGDAQDQRAQAQTAADAAALAAVADIKDRAAQNIMSFGGAHASYSPTSSRSAAETYARENHAVLDDIRASDDSFGSAGHIVRVEVRGALCQRELEDDRSRHWADMACDGTEEDEDIPVIEGNASAIAEVDLPSCYRELVDGVPQPPVCDGVTITDMAGARSVIDVRLVEEEGRYMFRTFTGGEGLTTFADAGSNRALAQERLGEYGWDNPQQWNCLDNLWENESNWDHTVENYEGSGAYGIPQVLPSAHPGVLTPEFRASPEMQIDWGLDYIQGRYGSPCAAWTFWQAQSPHWY